MTSLVFLSATDQFSVDQLSCNRCAQVSPRPRRNHVYIGPTGEGPFQTLRLYVAGPLDLQVWESDYFGAWNRHARVFVVQSSAPPTLFPRFHKDIGQN